MPAISTPDARICSLCNSIHPQRPACTPHSPGQTPTLVMVCENHQYATSPYGPPPVYEGPEFAPYEGTEAPPTYSAALFDELGQRISRIREQLDTANEEDLTPLHSRENLDPWTACTTAFVRTRREERERLEPSMRERLARTTTSTGRALPPELWSIDELLHRARLRPTPRQQTSTSHEQTSRPPGENLSAPARLVMEVSPREGPPPPLRPRRDLADSARPQVEPPSSLQTRPISQEQTRPKPRPRQKNHQHGRASDVEDSINLICDGASLVSKKVVKVSRFMRTKYRQSRPGPNWRMNGEGR